MTDWVTPASQAKRYLNNQYEPKLKRCKICGFIIDTSRLVNCPVCQVKKWRHKDCFADGILYSNINEYYLPSGEVISKDVAPIVKNRLIFKQIGLDDGFANWFIYRNGKTNDIECNIAIEEVLVGARVGCVLSTPKSLADTAGLPFVISAYNKDGIYFLEKMYKDSQNNKVFERITTPEIVRPHYGYTHHRLFLSLSNNIFKWTFFHDGGVIKGEANTPYSGGEKFYPGAMCYGIAEVGVGRGSSLLSFETEGTETLEKFEGE